MARRQTAGGEGNEAGCRPALALAVGALGVAFGDIGTSPLCTDQTAFSPSDPHPVPVSRENVFGIVSLVVVAALWVPKTCAT